MKAVPLCCFDSLCVSLVSLLHVWLSTICVAGVSDKFDSLWLFASAQCATSFDSRISHCQALAAPRTFTDTCKHHIYKYILHDVDEHGG